MHTPIFLGHVNNPMETSQHYGNKAKMKQSIEYLNGMKPRFEIQLNSDDGLVQK